MPWLSVLVEAEHMGRHRPVRIDALVLGQEAHARQAEAVDFLLLLLRDAALDPDEALPRPETRAPVGLRLTSGRTAVRSSTPLRPYR